MGDALDNYFHISERGSTVGTEIRGGLVTFFTMAYILVLNPIILGAVPDGTGNFLAGGDTAQIAAVTALTAGVMSILMGVVAKFPMAIAAGMGLNAIVAYSIAARPGMTWADAMGIVVMQGIIILVLVLTGFREAVFRAVPMELKVAISVGIGLFIAFIGLVDSGFVRPAAGAPVELGINGSLSSWPLLVFVVGLLLAAILSLRKVKGAILISIIVSTILAFILQSVFRIGAQTPDGANPGGWALTVPEFAGDWGLPNLSLLGHFSLLGSFRNIGVIAVILLVFTYLLADFFDTIGTMVAVASAGGMLDKEGNPPNAHRILVVDSIGAIVGGASGVSSNTLFVESAAGVGDGARTGLASVVTGLAFLAAMFASPLISLVPHEAATPALVVVGFLMMQEVIGINWAEPEVALPAFLTIVIMPFSYSITAGIGAGIISYVIIKVAVGKGRLVHPFLYGSAVMFLIYFLQGTLGALVGL